MNKRTDEVLVVLDLLAAWGREARAKDDMRNVRFNNVPLPDFHFLDPCFARCGFFDQHNVCVLKWDQLRRENDPPVRIPVKKEPCQATCYEYKKVA